MNCEAYNKDKKEKSFHGFSKPGICSFTGVEEMAAVCFKFYGSSEKKVPPGVSSFAGFA